ncbi:hypothetical protein ASPVEDRAFT_47986 [Aspergillus versicolor CBS 583.65]|uniref:RING-type domain-containing protein n=1 Tax=Aspergillus versicolor CBS 583.65 TaxID=1036611 RepID=A0A1L9Q513_ASPVE|nr:uncharacterized protein ASPVEDRAFT_47986 [Aspergillus versicolor CBS 583.65]OJJ08836.1 hypothetical protein ASPVEDRAFT_47986 [Aspergillus versicolor CBS 583.65]
MEKHDLLLIVDATASMANYLAALNTSLSQIISISALTGCFSRIGVLAYRDYSNIATLLEFSEWLDLEPGADPEKQPDIVAFARRLRATGGGDYPEAAKTALAQAYSTMRPDAKTLILLYADAPPHTAAAALHRKSNAQAEINQLSLSSMYGGFGPSFLDWVSAANALRDGHNNAQVFALLAPRMDRDDATYYNYLCEITGGACTHLVDSQPDTISKASVELLLAWMGVDKDSGGVNNSDSDAIGDWTYYVSTEGIHALENEEDLNTRRFFPVPYNQKTKVLHNIAKMRLTTDVIKQRLPKKSVPAQNPAGRWAVDKAYRDMASQHLMRIIKEDVVAIAINPVFGALWRAVCKDRTYEQREVLLDKFSKAVGEITDAKKKDLMQEWLEESYNFIAEIQATIDSVPEDDQFPCVFLDPTVNFNRSPDKDDTDAPVGNLTRKELLEISRSCDPRILRRLGRILTQLSYVKDAKSMPKHIVKSDTSQARRIPLVLASERYGSQFWTIMLHTITPGTQLAPRAAALLAALVIRLGIPFLAEIAEREVLSYKDKWNNIEVPETFATSCMGLLLDANSAHQKTQRGETAGETSLLNESDRLLFERLIAFKMLEYNLDTPLTARIPWTPNKDVVPMGPVVTCRLCQYPRSVTLMGPDNQCGVCIGALSGRPNSTGAGVSHADNPDSKMSWVECTVPSCRGQYVVYDVAGLRCRPKCHYCRLKGTGVSVTAPVVECSKCTNRIIWPEEYRPSSFDVSQFVCTACESGRQTTEDIETSAKALNVENGTSWLAEDSDKPGESPFTNRSPFYIVSTMGADGFMRRISLFPAQDRSFTQRGKQVRNTNELISTLKVFVDRRKSARIDCSLCFDSFWPSALNPACGRRGCLQRICTTCSGSWYGTNTPGSIINPATLACPFCRRFPAPQTLAKYGKGVHTVKDLNMAIQNHGSWVYAWCVDCSSAKQFVERDCASGTPPTLQDWTCEECQEQARLARVDTNTERDIAQIKKIKPCPECGTMTQKIAGCGHITCPVEGCGTCWCYFCGEKVPEDMIYDHMAMDHGGIFERGELGDYPDDERDEFDDDDDDDDDDMMVH